MRLNIEKLGINGEGVGRTADNVVCFIDGALPNEIVDVDIFDKKSHYCKGKIKNIIDKSRDRIKPECPYYDFCGGCDLQHANIQLQKSFKRDKVIDTICKFAHMQVSVDDTYNLNELHYRNKMVFPVRIVNGETIVGMFGKNTRNIVDIDNCLLAKDKINQILDLTRKYIVNSGLKGYQEKFKTGDIKYIVIRTNDTDALITFVVTRQIDFAKYYEYIKNLFGGLLGVSIVISDSDREILSGKYEHLYGIEKLNFSYDGIAYSVDNMGFLQVNNEIKDAIYQKVLDNIDESNCVIDAYSGAGLLTALCARHAKYAVGLEINHSSTMSAIELSKKNKIGNIEFVCCDVKCELEKYLKKFNHIALILDPPRSGCDGKVLSIINQYNEHVDKIIYISCDVATLARDLNILKEKYDILEIQPMDMFPQTKHVECVVVLEHNCDKQ